MFDKIIQFTEGSVIAVMFTLAILTAYVLVGTFASHHLGVSTPGVDFLITQIDKVL